MSWCDLVVRVLRERLRPHGDRVTAFSIPRATGHVQRRLRPWHPQACDGDFEHAPDASARPVPFDQYVGEAKPGTGDGVLFWKRS